MVGVGKVEKEQGGAMGNQSSQPKKKKKVGTGKGVWNGVGKNHYKGKTLHLSRCGTHRRGRGKGMEGKVEGSRKGKSMSTDLPVLSCPCSPSCPCQRRRHCPRKATLEGMDEWVGRNGHPGLPTPHQ